MATVIRRSSDNGDPRLPRVPFKEPSSAQPTIRASSLSFQGGDGDTATGLASVEGGWSLGPGGSGTNPTYRIHSSGVPAYEFDATLAGASPERRPTIYNGSSSRTAPKSMLAVIRVLRLPTAASGVGTTDRDLHIVRAGTGVASTLSVAAPSVEGNGGRLFMRTPATEAGGYIWGPDFPMDGKLHFVAAVVDGTTGRLYLDEHVTTGTAAAHTTSLFTSGYSLNGAQWQLVEAAHYETVLTPTQVQAKRQHYRALYNF